MGTGGARACAATSCPRRCRLAELVGTARSSPRPRRDIVGDLPTNDEDGDAILTRSGARSRTRCARTRRGARRPHRCDRCSTRGGLRCCCTVSANASRDVTMTLVELTTIMRAGTGGRSGVHSALLAELAAIRTARSSPRPRDIVANFRSFARGARTRRGARRPRRCDHTNERTLADRGSRFLGGRFTARGDGTR